jgi:hypothetical protein
MCGTTSLLRSTNHWRGPGFGQYLFCLHLILVIWFWHAVVISLWLTLLSMPIAIYLALNLDLISIDTYTMIWSVGSIWDTELVILLSEIVMLVVAWCPFLYDISKACSRFMHGCLTMWLYLFLILVSVSPMIMMLVIEIDYLCWFVWHPLGSVIGTILDQAHLPFMLLARLSTSYPCWFYCLCIFACFGCCEVVSVTDMVACPLLWVVWFVMLSVPWITLLVLYRPWPCGSLLVAYVCYLVPVFDSKAGYSSRGYAKYRLWVVG